MTDLQIGLLLGYLAVGLILGTVMIKIGKGGDKYDREFVSALAVLCVVVWPGMVAVALMLGLMASALWLMGGSMFEE